MLAFLTRRWFLLTLTLVLVIGATASPLLAPIAAQKWLRDGIVAVVLFMMALPLEAREIGRTIQKPGAPALAVLMNSVAAPLLGWLLAKTLSETLGWGLVVAAATPCTLASATVWTRRAGGSDGVSLMVTVFTNVTCFLVTPFWLLMLTGQSASSDSLRFQPMVAKLALFVVLPMAVAQVVRLVPRIASSAARHKLGLGVLAQFGVLTMVFIGSIQMGQTLRSSHGGTLITQLPLMLVVVMTLHVTVLAIGIIAAKWFRFTAADQIAVGIAGSQKTLMVGLQVSLELGVSILPMIAYHVGQLLFDTLVVDRWRERHPPQYESRTGP